MTKPINIRRRSPALLAVVSALVGALLSPESVAAQTPDVGAPVQIAPTGPQTAPTETPIVSAPAVSAPTPAPAAPTVDSPTVTVAAGKGLTATSADKRFQIQVRSRVQLRESFVHSADLNTNEIQLKTLRLFVQGYVLSPDLKYVIQLAFGSGDFDKDSSSPVFDAFVEYTKLRDLNLRFGQYFVPFDRARTIREFALQFVDRQLVVRELTLDRDVGLMLSSSDLFGLKQRLAYNLFVGSGDGKNRIADTRNEYASQHASALAVARIIVRPFGAFDDDQEGDLTRSPTPKLAIGIAGAFNKATGRQRGTTGDTYTMGSFDYAHGAADLVFKWRGFALLAEGLVRKANKQSNQGMDAAGRLVTERSRSGFGYFVQAGQMLTDKLEVTARWDDLHARKGTDPALVALVNASGRQLGTGLNLYLNGHLFKLQADYFYIFGEDIGTASHSLRAQLDATF